MTAPARRTGVRRRVLWSSSFNMSASRYERDVTAEIGFRLSATRVTSSFALVRSGGPLPARAQSAVGPAKTSSPRSCCNGRVRSIVIAGYLSCGDGCSVSARMLMMLISRQIDVVTTGADAQAELRLSVTHPQFSMMHFV
jgi:hypothetical protein